MAKEKKGKKGGKTKMDIMSILGWSLGTICIVASIIYVSPSADGTVPGSIDPTLIWSFWDVPSVAITIGGTITALMCSLPIECFINIPKHLKIVFFPSIYDPMEYVSKIVEFGTSARVNGLLSLENQLADVEDEFLKNSLMMVVDTVDPEKVRAMMENEISYMDDRHALGRAVYEKGAGFAPAFGMIGTLIGLVKMLGDMGDDSSSVGPAMAVALITTFYGTLLSNFLFAPIATKLTLRHDEEFLCKTIIMEGVEAIQAGENPKFIEEKLMQLVPKQGEKKKGKKEKKPK